MNLYRLNKASQNQIKELFHASGIDTGTDPFVDNLEIYVGKIMHKAERLECWDANNLVGVIAFYANNQKTHEVFVTMICVDPKYRGQGIASKLIEQLVKHARVYHSKMITLEVRDDNLGARKLYDRFGFMEQKRLKKSCLMTLKVDA